MGEPEIIVNCWLYTDSRLIYALAVRTYMMTGTDEEKFAVLNALAPTDFHFAYHFPLPDNYTSEFEGKQRKGLTFAGGVGSIYEDLSVFDLAFREINEKLTPNRARGVNADSKWKPSLDPNNLLHVKTFIEVLPNGELAAKITNPNARPIHKAQVSPIANLWSIVDKATKEPYAVSGRPYLAQGTDAEKRELLKKLASHDYRLSKKHPLSNQSTETPTEVLFKSVFEDMAANAPTITIGVNGRATKKQSLDPAKTLAVTHTIFEDSDAQGILPTTHDDGTYAGTKPWWKFW